MGSSGLRRVPAKRYGCGLNIGLWGLLGVQVPTKEQTFALSEELKSRAGLPAHVGKVLKALPANAHPMTQFTTAVMALQVAAGRQAGSNW